MKIALTSLMNKTSSSYVCRDLITLLSGSQEVRINPISNIVCCDELEKLFLMSRILNPDDNVDCHITIGDGSVPFHMKARKQILYLFYDYQKFSDQTLKNFQMYDEIWAPSKWLFSNLINSKVNNIHYVPYGVDLDAINSVREITSRSDVRFFTMANWSQKKNIDLIIESFCTAFKTSDPVSLNIYMNDATYTDKYMLQWLALNNHKFDNPNYKYKRYAITLSLINEYFHTKQQYYNSLNEFDAGVFCYKTDVLCMPMLEMMALGKPCVGISYSGVTDYATDSNSYLIHDHQMEPAIDEKCKINGTVGEWAKIKHDDLISSFRNIIEESNTTKQNKLKESAKYESSKLNLHTTKKIIMERLLQ